jgi:hypothetical protein
MDAKETVQKGLDARKNVRAAEARAERYREAADVIRDNLFREQMSHKRARRTWLEEKAVLTGIINRQNDTIVRLREKLAGIEAQERESKRLRAAVSGAKAAVTMVVLICFKELEWIVPWLADSLTALSVTCMGFAVYNWLRIK